MTDEVVLTPEEEALSARFFQRHADQQRQAEETEIALRAQDAVDSGQLTHAEAAQILHAGGYHIAHAAFVHNWRAEEGLYAEQEAAEELTYLDANEYTERFSAQQQRERAQLEQDTEAKKRQLREAQVAEIQNDMKSFEESTPGANQLASAVAARLVQTLQEKLQAGGELPSTPQERAAAIETALKTEVVVTDATESIRQQVDAEWRILRKQNGARDNLMTAADIARAESAYKEARFQQLADGKMIDMNALQPSPTAEETTVSIAERYRERQATSTSFHAQIAEIEKRGKDANAARDRGAGISDEKARYREAYARAEEEAAYGEVRTTENAAQEASAKPSGYGPDGTWPDELGPAL